MSGWPDTERCLALRNRGARDVMVDPRGYWNYSKYFLLHFYNVNTFKSALSPSLYLCMSWFYKKQIRVEPEQGNIQNWMTHELDGEYWLVSQQSLRNVISLSNEFLFLTLLKIEDQWEVKKKWTKFLNNLESQIHIYFWLSQSTWTKQWVAEATVFEVPRISHSLSPLQVMP